MAKSDVCKGCGDKVSLPDITMAFQPIVSAKNKTVFAHEALVRGTAGQGAAAILEQVSEDGLYKFDQLCRTTAIDLASQYGLPATGAYLSINFLPNAVYEPRACIRMTLAAALKTGFPLDRIIFEFTEVERLDTDHLLHILRVYRSMGFKTAIDDFGAGFSSLALLADFQPDIVKLDMALIRGIDAAPFKRLMVKNILAMLADLGVTPLCEGVETLGEYAVLEDLGVDLMQGYLIARPSIGGLAELRWPGESHDRLRA